MVLFWITPECPYPPNTGGRIGMWKRLQYMSKTNDIYLFCVIDHEKEKQFQEDIGKICKSVQLYPRDKKLNIWKAVQKPYPAVSRWNDKLKQDIAHSFEIYKPDFVIVDFPQMIGVLPEKVRWDGRIVLNQHNIEFQTLRNLSGRMNNWIKKVVYRIVSMQMEHYESVIYRHDFIKLYTFVSSIDKQFFERRFPGKRTFLVPVGTEMKKDIQITPCCHNLIFVAKWSYLPNEEGALWFISKVLPLIKREVPDVCLYLVGKDPTEKLVDLGRQDPGIIVTGTVDIVEPYYDKCNVAIIPILSGGGVNVKLLEALGQGKLVVTTVKGIEGTDLRNEGHLLVADDAVGFATHCIRLLQSPEKYVYLLKNANIIVQKKYSWGTIVKDFEKELKLIRYESD